MPRIAVNASDAVAPCTLLHAGRVACGPSVRSPHTVNGRPIRATDVVPPLLQHPALISDAGGAYAPVAPPGLGSNNDVRVNDTMWCTVEGTRGTGLGTVRRPPYPGLMRIWLDLPDALGDRVAAPGQDLSEAAFNVLVIDAYRMGRLTEHEPLGGQWSR